MNTVLLSRSQTVTIDSCYQWAGEHYPLVKRAGLIAQSNAYSLSNIQKGYLPQVNIVGQAGYQSDVTRVSLPAVNIETLSKDQYRAYADLSQAIYDGGVIAAQQKIQKASAAIEQASLQKDLYSIRERINQIYFGTLLLVEQLKQNKLLTDQLQETKKRIDAALQNGTAYRTDADQLQSSVLLQMQRKYEIESGIESYLQMLSAFTGKKIGDANLLQLPSLALNLADTTNSRPELKLFDLQNNLYQSQSKLVAAKTIPKLSLFGQGGYGKPGFNQLKNEFAWYYIGGIRLNWSISSLYSTQKEKGILALGQRQNQVLKETFLFNNNLTLTQVHNESNKIAKLLTSDAEIIRLKENIQLAAKAKYENGVITLNDYLKEITELNQARLSQATHNIQFLLNRYNQATTLGK